MSIIFWRKKFFALMLTRRENLLIRPWLERRYIQHRKKVRSALPAIDNSPPPLRDHVCCKLKKIQKENERCTQIISDNFTLLQHLSAIMSTTRVDHFWEEPPQKPKWNEQSEEELSDITLATKLCPIEPTITSMCFLQRVGIYCAKSTDLREIVAEEPAELPLGTRKDKCYACSPHHFKTKILLDVRRPYTPPKERISRKPEQLPDWSSQIKLRCDEDRLEFRGKVWKKPEQNEKKKRKKTPLVPKPSRKQMIFDMLTDEESQSVILTRGGLSVAVKFPPHTDVVFNSTTETKVIQSNFCECKSFPRMTKKNADDTKKDKELCTSKELGSNSKQD